MFDANRILLVLDSTARASRAVSHALELARQANARIGAIYLADAPGYEAAALFRRKKRLERALASDAVRSSAEDYLAAVARGAGEHGIRFEGAVDGTLSPRAIAKLVDHGNFDLVIKATGTPRGRRLETWDHRLLEHCRCPVWLIPDNETFNGNTLAILDADRIATSGPALDEAILRAATDLADFTGSDLHLLCSWGLEGQTTLRDSPFSRTPRAEIDRLLDRKSQQAWLAIGTLASHVRYPENDRFVHLEEGRSTATVERFLATESINRVVLGACKRSVTERANRHHLAEKVITERGCSVISVAEPTLDRALQGAMDVVSPRLREVA